MTTIDLNSIQFYQPPTEASLPRKRVSKASTAQSPAVPERENPPKALTPSDEWNTLWGARPIRFPNVTDSPFKNHLSSLREEASNLKETEADLGYFSNISCDISVLNHDATEDDNSLSLLEQLVSDGGKIAKSKQTGSNGEVEEERLQNKIQSDGGKVIDSEFRHGKDIDALLIFDNDYSQDDDTDPARREAGSSKPIQSSCGLTSEEQDGNQTSLSTPSISMASSDTRRSIFCGKRVNHTTRVSPYDNSGLLTANDRSICEPIDEGPLPTKPDKDWRDRNEVEQHKEDDETDQETRENSLPLLRPTKKRHRPSAREKSFRKRGTKRHRFSSPFSSDLETDTGEESDYSIYKPSKAHDVFKIRPASSRSISPEEDATKYDKMEVAGERSRMAIIYEQQSWEGEIIDERNTKQGRGRPRKQYLIRWKSSWVDGGRLIASDLVRSWKEKVPGG
ncbi:MAG: hypothetical protein HETSPECPRED_003040 [Heterodermia speciosa]|uniref:Chromo domain-containing protein n=1 Tax=Heterodermia speciosa TaxID=116794 RepID=A0A8H3J665_9LECA|nr:MAG: hypothetical protein HETSPECPRED_003040 [Heterodermia speciosa]